MLELRRLGLGLLAETASMIRVGPLLPHGYLSIESLDPPARQRELYHPRHHTPLFHLGLARDRTRFSGLADAHYRC